MNGAFYNFFTTPASGNYVDYRIDVSPSKHWFLKDFSFGFANIPTGALHLFVPKREEFDAVNNTELINEVSIAEADDLESSNQIENFVQAEPVDPRYDDLDFSDRYELRKFPVEEYLEWRSGEFYPKYSEQGLLPSSVEEMNKTFLVSGDSDLLDQIEIITEFRGKNSKIYDQDGNFVFSYSEARQGPFSIEGNIFEYYQNYSINSLPVNTNLSRGCSDNITGFFYRNNKLEYLISARDHINERRWTPAELTQYNIWYDGSGIFSNEDSKWIRSESKADLSAGPKYLKTFNTDSSGFEDINPNEHLEEYLCKNISSLNGNYSWVGENENVFNDSLSVCLMFRIKEQAFLNGENILSIGNNGQTGGISIFHIDGTEGLNLYFMHGNISDISAQGAWVNAVQEVNINDDSWHFLQIQYSLVNNHIVYNLDFVQRYIVEASIDSSIPLSEGVPMTVGEIGGIEFGEVLIYEDDRDSGRNDRKAFIEGYFAHKWNMQDLLPVNHPYMHGYPVISRSAGLKGGPLENLQTAFISTLSHF